MSILEKIRQNALKTKKSVILSDGNDERTVKAAADLVNNNYANVALIGDKDFILPLYEKENPKGNIEIIDIKTDKRLEELAVKYYERRKAKGETMESALESLSRPCYFGAVAVNEGLFDGCVAGSISSSAEVLRGALRGIGIKKGFSKVSSFMIMETPFNDYGENGVFFMSDIAINPNPDAETLAEIAEATSDSWKLIMGTEAKTALLSYSTMGSAEGDSVEKVRNALKILKDKRKDILVDGELQFDAALLKSVGARKAPESSVAGEANVFIFPNLDAGNIGYKITERLCNGATATGPVLQGLNKPMNDLSRGCSWKDIVNTSLITIFQSENN